jgi:hypothetical protein
VIILSETALYRQVKSFVAYYHESRTHLSLDKDSPDKDSPESREVQPPEVGRIVAIPAVAHKSVVSITGTKGAQPENGGGPPVRGRAARRHRISRAVARRILYLRHG